MAVLLAAGAVAPGMPGGEVLSGPDSHRSTDLASESTGESLPARDAPAAPPSAAATVAEAAVPVAIPATVDQAEPAVARATVPAPTVTVVPAPPAGEVVATGQLSPPPVTAELPGWPAGTHTEVSDNAASFEWPDGAAASSNQMTRGAEPMQLFVYVGCDTGGACRAWADVTNTSSLAVRWADGIRVQIEITRDGEVVRVLDLVDPGVATLAPGARHDLEIDFTVSDPGFYEVSGSTTFTVAPH